MAVKLMRDIQNKRAVLETGDVIETTGCHNFTCLRCAAVICWGQDSRSYTPVVNFNTDTILESKDKWGRVLRRYRGDCPHCAQRYYKSAWLSESWIAAESKNTAQGAQE